MEGLQEQLDIMVKNLEEKTGIQIKEAFGAFEEKNQGIAKQDKEAFGLEIKELKASIEGLAKNEDLTTLNEAIETLSLKMKEKKTQTATQNVDFKYDFKSKVEENIEDVGQIRKGKSFKMGLDVKDMTLVGGSLVGDQPRSYSNDVAAIPRQVVNFVDLIGPSINVDGGTYTFPRETARTGAVATQVEGADKAILDSVLTMVDVNTDFLAGYTRYSKKMRNNLPFLQSFVPDALQRDYFKAENSLFYTELAALATVSTEGLADNDGKKVEFLTSDIANLNAIDYNVNGIVLSPQDWMDIAVTEKSTGAGYGLPGIVSISNGVMTINGIPVFQANWLDADKYLIGDWSTVRKVVTEGMSVEFSEEDGDNFKQNMITARVEAQIGLAVHRPDSIILGDFTTA